MSKLLFKIYIAGFNPRNKELISVFKTACGERLTTSRYSIEIIDILKNPEEAEMKKVLAVPTIIREKPGPEKRIIGDLSGQEKAEHALVFLLNDLNN